MYYRVAGLKKNNDSKEMIVRVSSRKEAEAYIPAAKSFLFPGENTDGYRSVVSAVPIKVNLGTTIPHYRITIEREKSFPESSDCPEDSTGHDWWETILSATNEQEARQKWREKIRDLGENPEEYEIFADEMTVEECIKEEERHVRSLINNTYLQVKIIGLTDRECIHFCRSFNPEDTPEQYYEALKVFNRYTRIVRAVMRKCNATACTVQTTADIVKKLFDSTDIHDYQKIFNAL